MRVLLAIMGLIAKISLLKEYLALICEINSLEKENKKLKKLIKKVKGLD